MYIFNFKQENHHYQKLRDQIDTEVQNLAKSKLKNASNTTLSGSSDPIPDTKSSNNQKDNNILAKLIKNDIDETDIKDKISKAQEVLEAHRESIKTLLNTTAHTPNTLMAQSLRQQQQQQQHLLSTTKPNDIRTSTGRLPNNNTRRVVFVNLDEDS